MRRVGRFGLPQQVRAVQVCPGLDLGVDGVYTGKQRGCQFGGRTFTGH